MPLSRIAFNEASYSLAQRRQIAQILQQTLTEEFAVPVTDCFQLWDSYRADNRVFDQDYLSSGRSEHYLLFQITAGKARSQHQQQRFMQQLSARLLQHLGIAPADVMIVIQYNRPCDWSFSAGEMFQLEQQP